MVGSIGGEPDFTDELTMQVGTSRTAVDRADGGQFRDVSVTSVRLRADTLFELARESSLPHLPSKSRRASLASLDCPQLHCTSVGSVSGTHMQRPARGNIEELGDRDASA